MSILIRLLVVVVFAFLSACDKKNENGLVMHQAQDDESIYLNYVYIRNMEQPGHPRIYRENTKTQIIQRIHGLIVCGDSSNIASTTVINDSVEVTCTNSIWGSLIEKRLRGSITNSTEYNAETEKFEQGRTVSSLVKHGGKTIIIGTKSGDPTSLLGFASNIPNLHTDPEKYKGKGIELTDEQTGETFYSKNITALQYDFSEFFKKDGEPGKKLAIQTAQHEIGHIFGLFHTFQFFGTDYRNDLVYDTPSHHPADCSNTIIDENIMAYCSSEKLLRKFTPGQIERMNKILQ